MAKTLTLSEKQQKLNELRGYSLELLKTATVTELKALVKGLIPGISKLSKEDLLSKIFELIGAVEAEEVSSVLRPELTSFDSSLDFLNTELTSKEKTIYEEVESSISPSALASYCRTVVRPVLYEINSTAESFDEAKSRALELVFTILRHQAASYEPSTQRTNKSYIANYLRGLGKTLYSNEDYSILIRVLPFLINSLLNAFRDVSSQVGAEYKTKVARQIKNEDDTKMIDISSLLQSSYNLLKRLSDGERLTENDWVAVSFAVALATGRRAAEVHSSGQFRPVSDYEIAFSGAVKQKGSSKVFWEENAEVVIPTLLPAAWCCMAVEWLQSIGKRYSTVEDVNPNTAMPFSRYIKKAFDPSTGIDKYHSLRAAYALASFINSRKGYYPNVVANKKNLLGWGSKVLIHSEEDVSTYQSYAVYCLVNEDITLL